MNELTDEFLESKEFKKEGKSFCLPMGVITFKVVKNGNMYLPSLVLKNEVAIPFRKIESIKDLEDLINIIKKIYPFLAD